jgi:hypothetical protein
MYDWPVGAKRSLGMAQTLCFGVVGMLELQGEVTGETGYEALCEEERPQCWLESGVVLA